MAQGAYQARTSGGPIAPDLAEALAAMAEQPEPLASLAGFLDAVAQGKPIPPVPTDLPPELAAIMEALVKAIEAAS